MVRAIKLSGKLSFGFGGAGLSIAFNVRMYATTACMSSSDMLPKCGNGITGNSGEPSFATPCVIARSNSPSVHDPIAAGVMFFEYTTPAGPSENSWPPAPIVSGLAGPENFVQSRCE
jgi:hypothetical protein